MDWLLRFLRKIVPYNSGLFRCLYYVYIRWRSKSRLKQKTAAEMDIQVHAAEHCNLGCKSCNAFSPVIEKCFADIEAIKKDLTRLSELTGGNLKSLTVSGGEPLLNPQLPEILEYARKYFPEVQLQIITNGTLLEKAPDKFWTVCKNNNVIISLTCYPINLNIEKIKETAAANNVAIVYQDDTDIREKTMYFSPLDSSGKQDIKKSYRLCYMANYCFVLENGRLYTCPTIAHIEHFNKFFNQNFVVSERDYIDIYKAENINEITGFMCKPMPFCRYCDKKNRVSGLGWEVSKREISEWV